MAADQPDLDPRQEVYLLAALLSDIERVIHPLPRGMRGRVRTETVFPPALPTPSGTGGVSGVGGGRGPAGVGGPGAAAAGARNPAADAGPAGTQGPAPKAGPAGNRTGPRTAAADDPAVHRSAAPSHGAPHLEPPPGPMAPDPDTPPPSAAATRQHRPIGGEGKAQPPPNGPRTPHPATGRQASRERAAPDGIATGTRQPESFHRASGAPGTETGPEQRIRSDHTTPPTSGIPAPETEETRVTPERAPTGIRETGIPHSTSATPRTGVEPGQRIRSDHATPPSIGTPVSGAAEAGAPPAPVTVPIPPRLPVAEPTTPHAPTSAGSETGAAGLHHVSARPRGGDTHRFDVEAADRPSTAAATIPEGGPQTVASAPAAAPPATPVDPHIPPVPTTASTRLLPVPDPGPWITTQAHEMGTPGGASAPFPTATPEPDASPPRERATGRSEPPSAEPEGILAKPDREPEPTDDWAETDPDWSPAFLPLAHRRWPLSREQSRRIDRRLHSAFLDRALLRLR